MAQEIKYFGIWNQSLEFLIIQLIVTIKIQGVEAVDNSYKDIIIILIAMYIYVPTLDCPEQVTHVP